MRSKELTTVGDVTLVVTKGTTPTTLGRAFTSSGVRFIKAESISSDGFMIDDKIAYIDGETDALLKRSKLQEDDVLFSIAGVIGRTAIVRNRILPANTNQAIAILRPNLGRVLPGFLYYTVRSQQFLNHSLGRVVQTAQANVSLSVLSVAPIWLPAFGVQRRVAGVLSGYDDIIENNAKRIVVLEEMARMLYREKIVGAAGVGDLLSSDGATPTAKSGWEWGAIEDTFKTIGGGTPSRSRDDYWNGGDIQWYSPTDLTRAGTMFIDDSADHITDVGLSESSAKLIPPFSVLMTSRATIGAIAINTHEAATNQGFLSCIPNDRVPLYFLLHWLKEHVSEFVRLGTGATFKEITRGTFRKLKILVPPQDVVSAFEKAVAPCCELILNLERKNRALRAARDLLLPKLLSGELSVDRIPDPQETAS